MRGEEYAWSVLRPPFPNDVASILGCCFAWRLSVHSLEINQARQALGGVEG